MTTTSPRLTLMGSPGSPYTRKMLALLRYRHIPYAMRWGGHHNYPEGLPKPKVPLLPTFIFTDDDGSREAMIDSTPIIRRLERTYEGRSVLPTDPELAFYVALIEDYADEWLTKCMFHYRWYHAKDRAQAGPLLMFWDATALDDASAAAMGAAFTKRQFERLYVVGSNDVTATTIEESYVRCLEVLSALLEHRGFVMGRRPSAADFALYGQLSQLGVVEPTSTALMHEHAPRVRGWVDRMDDLSGLEPGAWFEPEQARPRLQPLLAEVGRVYAPFLVANAEAAMSGSDQVDATIDGRAWTQPTFRYQVKCLAALRQAHDALPAATRAAVDATLAGTGCAMLFA